MAGVECVCPGKRKAASFSGEERSPTAKRAAGCSRGEEAIPAAKKMWRLPREEVGRIVDWPPYFPPALYRDLKRDNPSLLPSSEEEKDEHMVVLYRYAREFYEQMEEFAGFQARVRREYASKGFVEVDYDCVGAEAVAQRRVNQARGDAFGGIFAHLSSEFVVDADTFRQLKRKWME
ncbi:unnamed protein product [Triticum turgidum subsp. durum]|uniref:Uncharacterized protein n=1 Tax=Triticum turgidum subsp. durum TaxID=4567 RepID=A0A9R1Q5L2_TRITD|nr:unnamed protein product [Triticum turgidum subsp. durum]